MKGDTARLNDFDAEEDEQMPGGDVAYQLRVNKAVDRNIFIDTLLRLSGYIDSIKQYTYYGFAGPFFEDFKLLHLRLSIDKMVSLESDSTVYKRQEFNKPYSCIEIHNQSSSAYINKIKNQEEGEELHSPCIVWLDYAKANDRANQIYEFQSLISTMRHGDIAKITLNASPNALRAKSDKKQSELDDLRKQAYCDRMDDKLVPDCEPYYFSKKDKLARIVYYALYAALIADETGSPTIFQPILITNYADGPHAMLTCTGIVLDRDRKDDFLKKTQIEKWDMYAADCLDWEKVNINEINVPALTVKEKVTIDAHLPASCDTKTLAKQISDEGIGIKEKEIEDYIKYYRYYPNYKEITM